MIKNEKKQRFWDLIKDGLSYTYHNFFPSVSEGVETILKNVEDKVVKIERRIIRKTYAFSITCLGGLLLIMALFFYLVESLNWSNTIAFFFMGITFFLMGLLLQIIGANK